MSVRIRRTLADRLREALAELAQGRGQVLTHSETPWASVTFSGTRHRIELAFEGTEAVEAGECFIALLPEHEFAVPGQLVADVAVIEADHRLAPEPRLTIVAELLLLEES